MANPMSTSAIGRASRHGAIEGIELCQRGEGAIEVDAVRGLNVRARARVGMLCAEGTLSPTAPDALQPEIPRDGEEKRAHGIVTDAVARCPHAHERLGRDVLGHRRIARQPEHETMDTGRVVAIERVEVQHSCVGRYIQNGAVGYIW